MEPIDSDTFEAQSDAAQTVSSVPGHPPADRPRPGGFWRRVVSYLADLFLIDLIGFFLLGVRLWAVGMASAQESGLAFVDPGDAEAIGTFLSVWTPTFIGYFTFFTFWGGQTPGKMLMRIRVVTLDLKEVSLPRSLGRTLCYFASSLFFGLGFLIAAFNRDKRALHDFIAGTWVVRV
jgi:uncharacterized RDD family membrane protein YckC